MAKTKKERLTEVHDQAIREFDRVQSSLHEEREESLEDRRFYSIAGAQWEGGLSQQFENKPKFEVNKVHLAVIKIINEYRNNRITVDFISKDGTPDDSLADVCDGLFRADEQDSGAEEAYDNAFEEAVGGGFGAIRLTSQYENEEDDNNEQQRIRIEPIYDADSSVFFDLDAKRQDKADAKYCFVIYSMTREDYKETYDEDAATWRKEISQIEYDWYTPDLVYVAEYYKVEKKSHTVYTYEDALGKEERYTDEHFEDDPDLQEKLEVTGWTLTREKRVKKRSIHKYIMSGNKVLEDCGVIAGKNIPIVPTYGKRWFVDSLERCMGHVRLVKDTQRLKNMLMSKLAEISSLSTVQKPIFTPEMVAGHELMWSEDNIKNYPYLLVEPLTDAAGNATPSGPIAYTKPPQIPPALAALMQLVDIDQKELLGGSGETDKMLSHVSGKAHEMLQKRIDGQAFIYMSNFAKAVKRIGEVWLSMAKEVYVEKDRKMKTVDTLGQLSQVKLGEMGVGAKGTAEEMNDLTKASFDVTVDVGPSSASQREATVQSLLGMLGTTQDPGTRKVLEALSLYNMEGDGISETREFFRKQLVQMGVLQPTPEEAQAMAKAKSEPSAEDQALLGMAAESNAKAEKTKADVQKIASEIEVNKVKIMETLAGIKQENVKLQQEGRKEVAEAIQKTREQISERAEDQPAPGIIDRVRSLFNRSPNA